MGSGLLVGVSKDSLGAQIASVTAKSFAHVLQKDGVPQLTPDASPNLAKRVQLILDTFHATAIAEHPLKDFFSADLREMLVHADAIDRLSPSRAVAVHGRQVEELATTAQYVLGEVGRYNEFAWRWREFRVVHGIRNRIFNLKQPLPPNILEWVSKNLPTLQIVNKKFTGDASKDQPYWEKYSNWLHPISLREIFEKVGAKDSYFFRQYEWGSHSVHLSPMGEQYGAYELQSGMTYVEFVVQGAMQCIDGMARTALALVADRKRMRELHVALVLLGLHFLNASNQKALATHVSKSERFQAAIGEIMKGAPSVDVLEALLLGTEPADPLVLKPAAPSP